MKNNLFSGLLAGRILILDGAMGTMLQQKGLTAEDFGGPSQEGCNEILNLTRPEIVSAIHEAYLQAGADIIETNSFGATSIVLAEYGLQDKDMAINRAAALLARKAAQKWQSPEKPRFVAGSMGPTTKMLTLTAGFTYEELEEAYYRQAVGLIQGGVDLLLIETCQDTLNVKAAGTGIQRAFAELKTEVPLIISCTIQPSGTMLAGQNIEAFYVSIQHLHPLAVGLNCGTGAELMNDSLRTLTEVAGCALCLYPNAGLPDEEGKYRESPEEFASKMVKYAANGWLNIAGGCCGTTDRHIAALAAALSAYKPRRQTVPKKCGVSGLEAVWPEETNRPLLVGERSNVIGSRKFRDLIAAEKWEEGAEIARAQVKKGAQVIDICVANPDRDELADMKAFLPRVVSRVKVPLMLDSTDAEVIEAGLRLIQGKAIINSINLENGRERFERIAPLVQKYGAAVVVGLIDEEGMALTRERKLAVAERSYNLLVREYGIDPADIIIDPLTFPVGTGDSKYLGSAVETMEGLRLIKAKYPQCKTILGISNVSFGLPGAGREVLNAVFVYLNTLAGLDFAIVNAEKLERYATIPPAEKKLAEDVLLNTNDLTLKAFTDFYREKKTVERKAVSSLTLEERLAAYIVEGSREGLEDDLKTALLRYTPLEIINGPLMKGMEEVGVLFNQNQLIVAEVLQSAEVMKAAVSILEPFMARAEEAVKGKIVLATVKGDVHDIGKNLVEIILTNNGYKVINLGVKVSSEQLIEAVKKENPDAIGLSGLLVKSVQQMLLTAQDLKEAGIDIPLLLGGAALSRKFTEEKIAPAYGGPVFYARDAMDSLPLLHSLLQKRREDSGKKPLPASDVPFSAQNSSVAAIIRTAADRAVVEHAENVRAQANRIATTPAGATHAAGAAAGHTVLPAGQILVDYSLEILIPYLNFRQVLSRYLGIGKLSPDRNAEEKIAELSAFLREFLEDIRRKKLIRANGVYQFFPAYADGDRLVICDPQGENINSSLEEFWFPRQKKAPWNCLADYVRGPGQGDSVALLALTTGLGVKEQAELYKENGEYRKSYLLQALALELAEAFAEHLHREIRFRWGIPPTQGIRVSPGYAVFPDLENQQKIFRLLQPEKIGIKLTENMMMEPEASVTALVISNPAARIFKP